MGNAQSGGLSTGYCGPRPSDPGYNPMHKEGAIVLGIGGDNSIWGAGTFYEGVMTSGYPSDATEDAVQANITAAGYAETGQEIVGAGSGRCMDVPGATTNNGTQVNLWDCNGNSNQRWTYTSGKQLRVYGNKCLDAYNWGTSNGTPAAIWDCTGAANQQWNLNADGTITSALSGLCLEAAGLGTANGTKLQLWSCWGGSNQKWNLRN
ncbi:arabinofuranosidase catalytic domain-containing protein [Streptomyces cavernae]|uniref:arabinofuranosidase catalytic domain-containing protein n=1 Tax=Streptomyces cavernae TaxID=2259034 RepID=UPI0030B83F14